MHNEFKSRMKREWDTVETMIGIFCKDKHSPIEQELCNDCFELQQYAAEKLRKCRWQEDKPTCANCPIHCYRKSMAKKIKEVMRYAGPKMIYKHPIMAIRHLLDGRREVELPTVN